MRLLPTMKLGAVADAGQAISAGRPGRRRVTERARAERRLAWMLCAPAIAVMALVAVYPIVYAIYLSFQRYDLRFPADKTWVGIDNYTTILSSTDLWWQAFGITVLITVVSVAIELVLGMAVAIVMHRAIFGRGIIRTAVLVPYGIVTVAAAFSWQYAWTPGPATWRPPLLDERAAHAPVAGRRDHHPGRGVEDHAVHGPPAPGGPLARA